MFADDSGLNLNCAGGVYFVLTRVFISNKPFECCFLEEVETILVEFIGTSVSFFEFTKIDETVVLLNVLSSLFVKGNVSFIISIEELISLI